MKNVKHSTKPARARSPRRPTRAGATGRPATETVLISSPTVPGERDEVERVVDHLDVMRRARQVTPRQWSAIELIRHSWEIIEGQAGGAMDFMRPRGGSLPGKSPAPHYMQAADTLRRARQILYPLDHRILILVIGKGMSFRDIAQIIQGFTVGFDSNAVGTRFRTALDRMADELFGPEKSGRTSKILAYLPDPSRPVSSNLTLIVPGPTAHATSRKVLHT